MWGHLWSCRILAFNHSSLALQEIEKLLRCRVRAVFGHLTPQPHAGPVYGDCFPKFWQHLSTSHNQSNLHPRTVA